MSTLMQMNHLVKEDEESDEAFLARKEDELYSHFIFCQPNTVYVIEYPLACPSTWINKEVFRPNTMGNQNTMFTFAENCVVKFENNAKLFQVNMEQEKIFLRQSPSTATTLSLTHR